MSTNAIFLEDDYVMDQKSNDRFDLRELSDTPREPLEGSSNPMEDVPKTTTLPLLDTREPYHNIRIVRRTQQQTSNPSKQRLGQAVV